LAIVLFQVRFVVKGVYMTGRTILEEENDAVRGRREMRLARFQRIDRIKRDAAIGARVGCKEGRESDTADARAGPPEEIAARHIGGRVHGRDSCDRTDEPEA